MTALSIVFVCINILCGYGFNRALVIKYDVIDWLLVPFFGFIILLIKPLRECMFIGYTDNVEKYWMEYLDEKYFK